MVKYLTQVLYHQGIESHLDTTADMQITTLCPPLCP